MDTHSSAPTLRLEHVTFGYNSVPVLRDVNLVAPGGAATVILGRSGVGKSTVLRLIVGLVHPQQGHVYVNDRDVAVMGTDELHAVRRRIGVCFQSGALLNSLSVAGNIAFPLERAGGYTPAQIRERVAECLEVVGLADSGDVFPAALSGGMRKRAGFARALALDPDVLLFDEPTSGLDPILAANIEQYVQKLKTARRTLLVVTHTLPIAFDVADHIVMLHEGGVLAKGTPDELRASTDPLVRQFLEGRPDE